jgi:hypothetical protein
MLDFFLVLGQIPGTNIQITFDEILFAVLLAGIYLYVRIESRPDRPRVETIQLSQLHGFSYPIGFKPAVRLTRRKAAVLLVNTFFHRLSQAF